MPSRVLFAPDEAFGLVELSGVVRWGDVASALCALLGHPAWVPFFAVLWDARAATALDVGPADLPGARGLMEALAAARAYGRSAVVVGDEATAALVATLAGLGPATAREVRAFYGLEEALRFLGRRTVPEGMPVLAESPRAPSAALASGPGMPRARSE